MDTLQQTVTDRIKAYIYFGVEAEMELVEAKIDLDQADDDADKDFFRKKIDGACEKVALCNKRIEQLENPRRRL
jgi:hypothetical protein